MGQENMDATASFDVSPSLDAEASARWDALTSEAPVEAPVAPAETPAPETVTNTAPEPEAATPPAEVTNTEKPAVEPTAFEKWVAKYGDQEKAAQEAWATNTRAAELARENAELKAKLEQPAATNAPEPVPGPSEAVAPAPVVEAAPEQVEQWVAQQVLQDQTCKALDTAFRANAKRLTVLTDPENPESHHAAAKEIQKLQAWLQFPQVAEDEFAKSNIQAQLANARAEYQARKLEAQGLDLENRDYRTQFEQRQGQYRSQITEHYASQKRAAQVQQETQTVITRHATELSEAWTPAVTRTIEKHKIPETEVDDFKEDLRTQALATLESGIPVKDLDAFMSKHAERLMKRLDRAHREKAAEYGRLATQRASTPAPVPSVVPQVQPSTGDLTKDAYAHENAMWDQIGIR